MPNMKNVKLRIKSVSNTMQITKAMQMVAASKLRRAKERADQAAPYFESLRRTLSEIKAGNRDFRSVYTRDNGAGRKCYILIAGDRGMAGGYNVNLFRQFEADRDSTDFVILPLGKKSAEYCRQKGYEILTEQFMEVSALRVSDCYAISGLLCEGFRKKQFSEISIYYTRFISMLTQTPDEMILLPLSRIEDPESREERRRTPILYEPSDEEVFDAIVPEYLCGLIYSGLSVSVASELAARRAAMEAATENAGEMIDQLNLFYNRARQASITQEITEIVAGAEEL